MHGIYASHSFGRSVFTNHRRHSFRSLVTHEQKRFQILKYPALIAWKKRTRTEIFSMSQPTARLSEEFAEVQECTVPVSDSLALRVYSDTRPHNGKIAELQKGLILIHKDRETVGEGTGFGLPVLICSDETYFSEKVQVYLAQQENASVVRKEFYMDKIARNQFRNVKMENPKLRVMLRYIAGLYQRRKGLRNLTLKDLYMKMGIQSNFVKTPPAGKIIVTYRINRGIVHVKADFNHLAKRNLQRIFMLNEQGAKFFRKYTDSDDIELTDKQIGAWNTIETEWASLMDMRGVFGFRLRKLENSILHRGQEFLEGSLDWVGLDYEVNPKNAVFEYDIEILGV
jgi:hypothetical protein